MLGKISASIVVPTHNRCESLKRALDALCIQEYSMSDMEVLVVADTCSDCTWSMLQDYVSPYKLTSIQTDESNAAAARNLGASKAKGEILIFLDDDIEVTPRFVASHAKAQAHRKSVVIGCLNTKFTKKKTFFQTHLRGWWDEQFQSMKSLEHRFSYQDLLSGNFSINATFFDSLKGFDESLKCKEDYDLGVRLLDARAEFIFSPESQGTHHEVTDFDRCLKRKYSEGIADIQLVRRHPSVLESLVFYRLENRYTSFDRFIVWSIFRLTFLSDAIVSILCLALKCLEFLRFRLLWRTLHFKIMIYWYMRGVASEFFNLQAFSEFVRELQSNNLSLSAPMKLDLECGLKEVESILQALRPKEVLLYYKSQYIEHIEPGVGVEPLRGNHLKSLLAAEKIAWPLTSTLYVKEKLMHAPEGEESMH